MSVRDFCEAVCAVSLNELAVFCVDVCGVFAVCIYVIVNCKLCAGELVVGVIFVNLENFDVALDNVIDHLHFIY